MVGWQGAEAAAAAQAEHGELLASNSALVSEYRALQERAAGLQSQLDAQAAAAEELRGDLAAARAAAAASEAAAEVAAEGHAAAARAAADRCHSSD